MVVLSRPPMSTASPVLVGAGALPELVMRDAVRALARHGRCSWRDHGVGECPQTVLQQTAESSDLLRLSGDPAELHASGGTWLQALADWQRPTLLMVRARPDGGIPGSAAAYAALAERVQLPLLGVVQLEGEWDRASRIRDGLPWCGWIPASGHPLHDEAVMALAQRVLPQAIAVGSGSH